MNNPIFSSFRKFAFIVISIMSILLSIITAISLLAFLFDPADKHLLQFFLGSIFISALLWGLTFFLASANKTLSKADKIQEIKNIIAKFPLILVSVLITSFYTLVYFFFFGFLTVSKYGHGGWGADAGGALILIFICIGLLMFAIVMYNVFKTDRQDITLTLYNQFTVLKWSSLVALFFGIWSTFYFYHAQGAGGWAAMIFWDFLLFIAYKFFAGLSKRVHRGIMDHDIHRIVHETKKAMINRH